MARFYCVLLTALLLAQTITAQSSPPTASSKRDQQGLAVLAQALAAAGGETAIVAVQDYTGTGQITYFWAGREVIGAVTVRARGTDQFRLDANLSSGTRSWAVSKGSGTLKEVDGKTSPIPFHNAVTLGSLTFPLAKFHEAALDLKWDIADKGLARTGTQQFRQIGIHKDLLQKDPDGSANRIQTADFYFDPQTNLLSAIHDQTHPTRTMTVDVPHSLYFSDYRLINGVLVPFSITEYVGDQRTWTIQLTQIKFNSGLSDADFQL